MIRYKAFIYLILILVYPSCDQKKIEADLIVKNTTIYSMDEQNAIFEALVIKDGKILDLGTNEDINNKYVAKNSIDANGKTIFPGFIDAHCHFIGYGLSLQNVDLMGTSSFQEVIERTVDHAKKYPSTWITGRGWDQNDWEDNSYPDRAVLDSLFPNTPVLLRRVDGHAAIANEKALELASITVEAVIDGGEINIENNRLTGVLIDNAVDLVKEVIPERTTDEKTKAILEAQENCFAVGLTTVDDAGIALDEVWLLDSLHKTGELKMNIYAMLTDSPENFDHFLKSGPYKTDKLNVRSFKFYGDGALGSRGACLLSPYSDISTKIHHGFLLSEIEYFENSAKKVYDAGFQMNTHCIGDSTNRTLLDIYAQVLQGENNLRWRIEHAQVVHKKDIPKFSQFSIIPSVQPTHATSDMYWAGERLGKRLRRAYSYKELRNEFGSIALGTDFPVEGIDPLNTFYAAVFRKDKNDYPPDGFLPENSLTRLEALKGMTTWAAFANFEEEEKGSLEVGKNADLVILNQDLLTIDKSDVLSTNIQYTIIAGEIVYKYNE